MPFGEDDRRVYVCLTASLSTLQSFAELTRFRARLCQFEAGRKAHLHRDTHTLPFASFESSPPRASNPQAVCAGGAAPPLPFFGGGVRLEP